VRDAESHADEDRRQRELVETRNAGESAAYQAEKNLADNADSIDESSKTEIEEAIKALRESLESEDVNEIRTRTEALQTAFHKVSEQTYANAAQQAAADGAATNGGGAEADAEGTAEEEVVDAEVVDGETRQ
jgi:molecular chaperone DnaK